MNAITELTVNQIRIFPVDTVPLGLITTKTCADKVRELLAVSEVEVRPLLDGNHVITFRRGELKHSTKVVVIRRVEVDQRRITVEVEGTSEDSNAVYTSFLSALGSALDTDLAPLRSPLLVAETTQCVATLDYAFEELFNSAFIEFLNHRVAKEASSKLAKASVRPALVAAEVSYQIDRTLVESKTTMSPKEFTIAPRPGVPSEARKYLVSSPFDSNTHIRLLRELSKAIAASRSK